MAGAAVVKPESNSEVAQDFRAAMRALAGGVVMVTTWVDGRPWGLTVSSCCSISVDPPKIFVSLFRRTQSRQAILDNGTFGVNFLSADHRSLAELGAQPGTAKFVDDFCEPGADGRSPAISGALAHLDCTPDQTFEVSDHTLFIGDVRTVVLGGVEDAERRDPLLYFDRAYRGIGERL